MDFKYKSKPEKSSNSFLREILNLSFLLIALKGSKTDSGGCVTNEADIFYNKDLINIRSEK